MARSIFYRTGNGLWNRAQTSVFPYVINGLAAGTYQVDDGLEIHDVVVTAPPVPVLTISAPQVQDEGNSGTKTWTYTITRSIASGDVTVNVDFVAGGTNAADWQGGVLPSGLSVTMANGVASANLVLTTVGDVAVEGDESFTLQLAPPSGYQLGSPNSTTGTITNDDVNPPTVSISGAQTRNEGNSGTNAWVYTITRSASGPAVDVPWSFSAGGTNAADYAGDTLPTGGVVTIPNGALSADLTVTTKGDTVFESDESFTITIAAPSGYTLGTPSSATGTILNDDSNTPISAVAADGWTATMPSPTDLAFTPIAVTQQGFDSNGNATTHSDVFYTTKRIRQVHPNHALLTTDKVALDDFLYSSSAVTGADTSACPASPKPVIQWADADCELVGNTLTLEVSAFHRDGMAAVRFFVTDGSTTVTATTSTPVVSPRAGDQYAVIVYRAVIDISSLANPAALTVNAWGFPRFGAAASISKSDDLVVSAANRRLFSPRSYLRNTALLAAPPLIYVSPTGTDTTAAVVSTDPAAAAAAPAATITYALTRARAVLGATAGALNALRVRLTEGTHTWTGNGPSTASTVTSEVIIEAAPGAAKANTILAYGGATARFNLAYVRWRGITVNRTGASGTPVSNTAGSHLVLDGVAFNNNGQTGALGTTAQTGLYIVGGTVFTGVDGSLFKATTGVEIRLIRGVVASHSTGAAIAVETWNILGSRIVNGYTDNSAARDQSGTVLNGLYMPGCTSSIAIALNTGTGLLDGAALVNVVLEETGTAGANRLLSISGDGAEVSTRHVMLLHITAPGFDTIGRPNLFYNETAGTVRRTHSLMRVVGCLLGSLNTKHDVFVGVGDPSEAPNRTGGWSFLYGVGCEGTFTMYRDAGSGGFAQDYPGRDAKIGTSNTVAQSPLFTDPKHTTSGPTAGAGSGTYTLQSGSPARGMVTNSQVPFDITGAPRSSPAAAGAYA